MRKETALESSSNYLSCIFKSVSSKGRGYEFGRLTSKKIRESVRKVVERVRIIAGLGGGVGRERREEIGRGWTTIMRSFESLEISISHKLPLYGTKDPAPLSAPRKRCLP